MPLKSLTEFGSAIGRSLLGASRDLTPIITVITLFQVLVLQQSFPGLLSICLFNRFFHNTGRTFPHRCSSQGARSFAQSDFILGAAYCCCDWSCHRYNNWHLSNRHRNTPLSLHYGRVCSGGHSNHICAPDDHSIGL